MRWWACFYEQGMQLYVSVPSVDHNIVTVERCCSNAMSKLMIDCWWTYASGTSVDHNIVTVERRCSNAMKASWWSNVDENVLVECSGISRRSWWWLCHLFNVATSPKTLRDTVARMPLNSSNFDHARDELCANAGYSCRQLVTRWSGKAWQFLRVLTLFGSYNIMLY